MWRPRRNGTAAACLAACASPCLPGRALHVLRLPTRAYLGLLGIPLLRRPAPQLGRRVHIIITGLGTCPACRHSKHISALAAAPWQLRPSRCGATIVATSTSTFLRRTAMTLYTYIVFISERRRLPAGLGRCYQSLQNGDKMVGDLENKPTDRKVERQ